MAFDIAGIGLALDSLRHQGSTLDALGGTRPPKVVPYITGDTHATVEAAGYFATVATHFNAGDFLNVRSTSSNTNILYVVDKPDPATVVLTAYATAPPGSGITNVRVSAGTTSNLLSDITFADSNGLAFGLNASTITGSYTVPGATVFSNSNNVSFGLNGSTVTATATFAGGGGAAISAGTESVSTGTVVFSNSNAFTFGMSGSSRITVSYTTPVVSNAIAAVGSAAGSGTNTSRFAADDHVHAGVYSAGVSNVGSTAGNTGVRPGQIVFAGSNAVTLSQETAAGSLQTVHIQGPVSGTTASRVESINVIGTRGSRFANEDHQHAGLWAINVGGNTSGGDTSSGAGSFMLAGGPNITLSGATAAGGMTLSVSAGAAGGGATLNFFEPYLFDMASLTSSGGIDTLFVVPFVLQNNHSFAQLNMIGSVHAASTSAGQTNSLRITGASSQRRVASYTISNTNYHDFFLFSKGTGGFSTDIGTFFSTRHSVVTIQGHTYDHSATNGAGSTASHTIRSSIAMTFSYPSMTSGTRTSVNAASTITSWGPGYTSFTSSTSNTTSNTWNTTTTGSTSMTATWPASTNWASFKMIPFGFATSLSAGEYWLGFKRSSLTSSSSSQNVSHGSVTNNSFTSTLNASNLTQTAALTYAGFTATLVSSLGWLGEVSQASMAPMQGHGSFSATYSPGTTYNNNLGQPVGEIAFSQLRSNVSFFRPWFQMANTRI